jgi:hypothetical protein
VARKASSPGKYDIPIDPLQTLIDRETDKNPRTEPPRSYIGASSVGHPCDAYLSLCLRGFGESNLPARSRRVFTLGSKIEDLVIEDLRTAGYSVEHVDPSTGKQWRWTLYGGHVACHADGILTSSLGERMVLECKSMNYSKFNAFRRHGLSYSHPAYVGQAQMLMGMSGLKKLLIVAYCKNDSRYGHEIIEFDEMAWQAIKFRIESVASGSSRRITHDQTKYPCTGCHKLEACWSSTAKIAVECKSCAHAVPVDDGSWYCKAFSMPAVSPCATWKRFQPS